MQHIAQVTALNEFNDHKINAKLRIITEIINMQNIRMINLR